jgi:hypothetical protein
MSKEDALGAGTKEHPMDAFDYLLDLSMSMSDCDTDRDALLEAHESLAAMSEECGEPTTLWSVWTATRSGAGANRLAA